MMVVSNLITLKEDRVETREDTIRHGNSRVVHGDFILVGLSFAVGNTGLMDLKSGSLFPFTSINEVILNDKIVDVYRASVEARNKEDGIENSKPT